MGRKNEKGFGILELTLALALILLSFGAFQKILQTGSKTEKHITQRAEFTSLSQSLFSVLTNRTLCSTSLFNSKNPGERAKFDPDGVSPDEELSRVQVKDLTIAANGQKAGAILVTKLVLNEIDPDVRNVDASGNTHYFTELILNAKKTGEVLQGSENLTKRYLLWVETDKNKVIQSCGATEDATLPVEDPPDPSPSPSPPPSGDLDLTQCSVHNLTNGHFKCPGTKRAAFVSCAFRETLKRDDVYPEVKNQEAYCKGSNAVNSGIALCCVGK